MKRRQAWQSGPESGKSHDRVVSTKSKWIWNA